MSVLNVALNKPSSQSSVSQWSKSDDPFFDASGGNNGNLNCDYGFHTGFEQNPWWQVDLQAFYCINKIVIHNRVNHKSRIKEIRILLSMNGVDWNTARIVGQSGMSSVLNSDIIEINFQKEPSAKYVRVVSVGNTVLHLREVEVFGDKSSSEEIKDGILSKNKEIIANFMSEDNKNIIEIDGLKIILKEEYSNKIVGALREGWYEGGERKLCANCLIEGDKVLEAGTAIGLVSMTASRIVGPENVFTFDANPEIVKDARNNFKLNKLDGISSFLGILKSGSIQNEEKIDFHVSKEFWASRLAATNATADIIQTVSVPVFSLEATIKEHNVNVLIIDIEGGEADLLTYCDLSGINKIIMETHYWAIGREKTDKMINNLISSGFNIDLEHSAGQIVFLRR